MPALPSDVIRATRDAQVVIRTDSAIKAMFPGARDGLNNPDSGYFETASDATTVLGYKASLIGAIRRRYRVDISGELIVDPLAAVPSFQLVDSELDVDKPVMLGRIEVDLENETTLIEVIG